MNILKKLFSAGKNLKKTVENSTDFLDEFLEKEYITGSIDRIKESTGNAAVSAGTIYQKAKNKVDGLTSKENIRTKMDQIKAKGEEFKQELYESMDESTDTIKNVVEEGKDILGKIFGEEE